MLTNEVRDGKGRKIQMGQRVFVISRPGLHGIGTVGEFRGIVGRVNTATPDHIATVQVFNIVNLNDCTVRPEHIRVQYGKIEAMGRFEQSLETITYGVAGQRDIDQSRGKASDLRRAIGAYRRRSGRDVLNATHRMILENVLACRKEHQSRPGYQLHEDGSISIVSSSRVIRDHVQELEDIGVLTIPIDSVATGCYILSSEIDETSPNPIADYIKGGHMAKEAAKTETGTDGEDKPKKSRKSKSKVDFSTLTPEDFFRENAKGQSVFKPGHDARYAGILKRVAEGNASPAERKLAFNKKMTGHPKVSESEHFKGLLEAAEKAAA